MFYRLIDGAAAGLKFEVTIDDKTMTWASDPPGHTIPEAIVATFTAPGPYGDDRDFKLFPNGRARPA